MNGRSETNKKVLRELVPGVVAKDYEVKWLNIYNLILFLAGKQVNGALGEDVINYGEIFDIALQCYSQYHDNYTHTTVFVGGTPDTTIPENQLQNVEEVAKYMENITCDAIRIYCPLINKMTKKVSQQVQKSKSVGDDNLRGIIYNAATDRRVMINAIPNENLLQSEYTKIVAPQLLENQVNKTLIITMWREAVESLFEIFLDMIWDAAAGKPQDPEQMAQIYADVGTAEILLGNGISVVNRVMGTNIQYENPTVMVSQPVASEVQQQPVNPAPNMQQPIDLVGWNDVKPGTYYAPEITDEQIQAMKNNGIMVPQFGQLPPLPSIPVASDVQDMASIDEALKKELLIMHRNKMNHAESSGEYSAIEEMIIQKILQEKMQERKISVG